MPRASRAGSLLKGRTEPGSQLRRMDWISLASQDRLSSTSCPMRCVDVRNASAGVSGA